MVGATHALSSHGMMHCIPRGACCWHSLRQCPALVKGVKLACDGPGMPGDAVSQGTPQPPCLNAYPGPAQGRMDSLSLWR